MITGYPIYLVVHHCNWHYRADWTRNKFKESFLQHHRPGLPVYISHHGPSYCADEEYRHSIDWNRDHVITVRESIHVDGTKGNNFDSMYLFSKRKGKYKIPLSCSCSTIQTVARKKKNSTKKIPGIKGGWQKEGEAAKLVFVVWPKRPSLSFFLYLSLSLSLSLSPLSLSDKLTFIVHLD